MQASRTSIQISKSPCRPQPWTYASSQHPSQPQINHASFTVSHPVIRRSCEPPYSTQLSCRTLPQLLEHRFPRYWLGVCSWKMKTQVQQAWRSTLRVRFQLCISLIFLPKKVSLDSLNRCECLFNIYKIIIEYKETCKDWVTFYEIIIIWGAHHDFP